MAQVAAGTTVGAGGVPGEGAQREVEGRSLAQVFWRRFRRDRFAIAGITFIVLLILIAVFAGLFVTFLTHHPPDAQYLDIGTTSSGIPLGASSTFWFGHDQLGRDLFVRVLYGSRTSLLVAFVATGISVAIGIILGVVAGFYRGWVDVMISRAIDVMLSLPLLLLAIGLSAVCGASAKGCAIGPRPIQLHIQPGLPLVIGIIAFANWPYIARLIRGQVLSLREKEFVEAAYASGATNGRIMLREILPNIAMPIIVYSSLIIPGNILFEAALSYLGVGVQPTTPSWGAMISDATGLYQYAPWMMIYPGLFLFLTTLAFNLVGDGLRDALDPRTGR